MNAKWMLAACTIVLIGHWLDLYTMIFPAFFASPMIGYVDIAVFVGFAALFLLVFIKNLDAERLVPSGDPYLEESVEQEHLEIVYSLRTGATIDG